MIDQAEVNTKTWIAAGGLSARVIPDALKAHCHHHVC